MSDIVTERSEWAQRTIENADVAAAHERTMFLYQIAIMGALAVKDELQPSEGNYHIFYTTPGSWFGFSPKMEWRTERWRSQPLRIGEAPENPINFTDEYMVLEVESETKNWTKRTVSGTKQTREFIPKHFAIERLLGRNTHQAPEIIPYTRDQGKKIWIEGEPLGRDPRRFTQWSPEDQIEDYDRRYEDVCRFVRELDVLIDAARISRPSILQPQHIRHQLTSMGALENPDSY